MYRAALTPEGVPLTAQAPCYEGLAMSEITRISPQEAFNKVKIDGYTYVDVRTEPEFAEGHPEGAINVPLSRIGAGGMMPNGDFLPVVEALFAKDAKIIVGCKSGGRSMRAAQELSAAGFTNVLDQRAGYDGSRDSFGQVTEPGWAAAKLPVSQGEPTGFSYADLRKKAG